LATNVWKTTSISPIASGDMMASRLTIGHLILIFALVALPLAATYTLYYPDERHYTDGALVMLQQGHWLAPANADGTPRFQKPPLAYWAVAISWLVFGVNTLAARLPFLLASCGTILLTFRLAKRLTGNHRTALLAAVILMANPQFILCSIRDMPDALLTFFLTLSGFGFLRLILWEELTAGAFWMAYGGAAGAFWSKGMLGFFIILFAWAFVFFARFNRQDVIRIIYWPGFASVFVPALGWIAYIVATHGKAAWLVLFDDQVTDNLHGYLWSPVWRAPLFALILIVNFLPWSLPAIELLVRKRKWPDGVSSPAAQKFILGWTLFLIVSFSLGSNLSLRYLLPGTPFMSVLLADWLQNSKSPASIFSLLRILKVTLVILLLAAMTAFFIGWECRWPILILLPTFILFGAGILLLWRGMSRQDSFSAAERLGLALVFIWIIITAGLIPAVLPDTSQQLAGVLRQLPVGASRPVVLVGDVQLASRLRVALGEQWVIEQKNRVLPAMTSSYVRFLVKGPDVRALALRGWQIQRVASSPTRPPPFKELIQALKSRSLRAAVARNGDQIYLIYRE
jgi:4-amino-4-deoxy-L-arabinose transferase-like glycosyltransferase